MPKKKTKKSAAKRFKLRKSGAVTFPRPGKGHLLSSKSRNRKRALRKKGSLSKPEAKRIAGLLTV